MEALQLELKSTIDATGGLECAQLGSRDGDIRVLARVIDEPHWLRVLNVYLEKEAKDAAYYSFIGKKYLLINGKMTAAWVVMLQGDDLEQAVAHFRELLQASHNFVRDRVSRRPKPKPGEVQPGEPKSYKISSPFGAGFDSRFGGGRVRSLTTRK